MTAKMQDSAPGSDAVDNHLLSTKKLDTSRSSDVRVRAKTRAQLRLSALILFDTVAATATRYIDRSTRASFKASFEGIGRPGCFRHTGGARVGGEVLAAGSIRFDSVKAGSTNQKVLPRPNVESWRISPPCSATRLWAIANPRPGPCPVKWCTTSTTSSTD